MASFPPLTSWRYAKLSPLGHAVAHGGTDQHPPPTLWLSSPETILVHDRHYADYTGKAIPRNFHTITLSHRWRRPISDLYLAVNRFHRAVNLTVPDSAPD